MRHYPGWVESMIEQHLKSFSRGACVLQMRSPVVDAVTRVTLASDRLGRIAKTLDNH